MLYQQRYKIRVVLTFIGLELGDTVGLEVAGNDDDDCGDCGEMWGCRAPIGTDKPWQQPSVFGEARL